MKFYSNHLRDIVRPNALPNILNVAVTGGIGSGKSTVAKGLQVRGAALVDLDAISRRITAAGGLAIEPLRHAFGSHMIDENGALNRMAMRELVFKNADNKRQLEIITHPIIYAQALKEAHTATQLDVLCIVYDIPLLFGNPKWLDVLDCVVYVSCASETRIERVLKRNPEYTYDTVKSIIAVQPTHQELASISDVEIENSANDTKRLQLNEQLNILKEYINNLSVAKQILINNL